MSRDDYETFVNTYFKPREIPIGATDPAKAVLYVQIPSPQTQVSQYRVDDITLSGDTLRIHLKQSGAAQVEAAPGFTGTWKWVLFLELDQANLKKDLKLEIQKAGTTQPGY